MSVWDHLCGQAAAVKTLQAAATEGRQIIEGSSGTDPLATDSPRRTGALAHSWLVTGPPGSGRSMAGRVLAAALQCTGAQVGCGECEGCKMVMTGSHPDVKLVATDKLVLSIDEARDLIPWAQTMPNLGRWRVLVVEDADRMVERTTNVLLKSIEEPPERTIWVLCSPTPQDMLTTIRSRCRMLRLQTPSVSDVANYLVATMGADPYQAEQAAILSQCHLGIARAMIQNPDLRPSRRNMFSTLIFPRSVGEAVLAASRVVAEAKQAGAEEAQRRAAAERADLWRVLGLQEGERAPAALRAQVKALEADQERRAKRSLMDALDRMMLDLLSFYRDVLALQLCTGARFVNVDMADEIASVANSSLAADTLARIEAIEVARDRLNRGGSAQIVVDSLAVALLNPQAIPTGAWK